MIAFPQRPSSLLASSDEQSIVLKDLVAEQQVKLRRLERELADLQTTAHQAVIDLDTSQLRLALVEGRLTDAAGMREDMREECSQRAEAFISACRAVVQARAWQDFPRQGEPVCPFGLRVVVWVLQEWSSHATDGVQVAEQLLRAVHLAGWLPYIPEAAAFAHALAERDRLAQLLWLRNYTRDAAATEAAAV